MKITKLYRYHGEGGTVDTTVLLPMEHEDMLRIEADEGKYLVKGKDTETVFFDKVRDIPVDDLGNWEEIDGTPVEFEAPETPAEE